AYDQKSISHYQDKTHNFKAGADYFLNKKNTLGFIITGNFNDNTSDAASNTLIIHENTGIVYEILYASNYIPGNRTNIDYNLNYRYADTSGTELNIDGDIVNFRRTGTSYQPNFYREPVTNILLDEKIYRNNTPTDINIYTFKIDYERSFYKGKLGLGGKYTDVKTKNIFDFYNVYEGNDFKDLQRSNKFNYDENVNALYINYNRPLNTKITAQAGIRLENTVSEGNLISNNPQPDDNVKRNYTDLFPSGALTYIMNAKNTFNLSYSRRIDRPSYQDLNPFENKLDELTYEKGNAFLRPQYTNSYQLSHTFLSRYTTVLGYSHIKDFFAQIIDTADKNRSFITQKNIAEQNIYSINISAPLTITKWWNAFLTFNGYHSAYIADFGDGKKIDLNVNAFSFFGQQTFTIKKGTTFELSGFFNSPTIWGGTFKTNSIGLVDVGVQQKLFKEQGNIKISFSDLFHTGKWKGTSDYGGAYTEASGRWESQQLKVNFTYRFGNTMVKAARQRKTASEEDNKRLNKSGGIGNQ
nr:TonB-dependent receptor [Chitinophagaceae bacterium]